MAFTIGADCKIHPTAVINVESGFIGAGSIVNEGARIEGTRVEIGREAFIDRFATIGGGSCFDPNAFLVAGDWLHMGTHSQINTARGVSIGHELGCGIETKIFTHGAYLDSYNLGAPTQWASVTIGDSVWLPNAWINPGVQIGSNVVVAARSLINKDIPAGALAGGSPCQILRQDYLPKAKSLLEKEKIITEIFEQALHRLRKISSLSTGELQLDIEKDRGIVMYENLKTEINFKLKSLSGSANVFSNLVKDQLRRNGIRFRFVDSQGEWKAWASNPLSYY